MPFSLAIVAVDKSAATETEKGNFFNFRAPDHSRCVRETRWCVLQSLKVEFEQQEAILKELEQLAVVYNAQGKTEAAGRLEQQSTLLRVRHEADVGL